MIDGKPVIIGLNAYIRKIDCLLGNIESYTNIRREVCILRSIIFVRGPA
jgi:hypothetical protein